MSPTLLPAGGCIVLRPERLDAGRGARALLYGFWKQKRYKYRTPGQQNTPIGWGWWRALM
ncbi:MAG: hypothetical protein LCI00_15845 [Chloroflexi bacterium]|nr:hypothetical protein [Chloroflexota bacterium]MCC6892701.1 hypothetical protein [Anaerolineae bacterium]